MASLRGLRKSSRMSSPANPATTPKAKDNSPGEAIQVKSDGKTFLDKWVEPPLRDPAPSFQDHKGLEPVGVLEKMVPLGEKPTPKLLQRLRLLPSKGPRHSTPMQTEEDPTPSNGISSRTDTTSPGERSPRSLSYEPEELPPRRTSRHSAANSETPVTRASELSTERPQRSTGRSPATKKGSPAGTQSGTVPTPASTPASQAPRTSASQSSAVPAWSRDQLQKIMSAAIAESDFRRDHIANLGLRNFWTEAANRPEALRIFANILDGTARKHEMKIFNRFILNAKEFLRHAPAPAPSYSNSHSQSTTHQYPGASRSGRMNGTIIEFTTPIVSQPPRQVQTRRAAPPATLPVRSSAPLQSSPPSTAKVTTPAPATNGVKRKREEEEDDDSKDESGSGRRSRSFSSESSLSEAKSLDDEIYAPKPGSAEESEEEVRVNGEVAVTTPAAGQGGEKASNTSNPPKGRPPTETNEKQRQVPSRSAARTANNNLASSFRPSAPTRRNSNAITPSHHSAKKLRTSDYGHDSASSISNNEQKNQPDKKEKLEQPAPRIPTAREKANLRDLNPPTKKDVKGRIPAAVPLTEEEQREVDEQRQILLRSSYNVREDDFPRSSIRDRASSIPFTPVGSEFESPRTTPKPDIKVHPLSRADLQLVSSPIEPPSTQRELRNGSVRKRTRNDYEEIEEAQTPTSTTPAEYPLRSATSKGSRAGTPRPNAAGKGAKRVELKKSARVIQSPQKKTGITAGMPRTVSSRQNGATDGNESDGTDNDEECSACGGAGELICCDGCPHAFHFSCVDPPLKAVPEGQWFCSRCAAERHQVGPSDLGIFNKLVKNYDEELPVSYSLPKQVQEYWDCVRRGPNGEYEEYVEPKTQDTFKLNRAGLVEIPDPKRLRDKDGNLIVCHRCKRTAANTRELVACDYCPAKWHMECVDHPMAIPPRRRPNDKAGSTWKCPLHIESLITDINIKNTYDEVVQVQGRLPKIRKPKRPIPYEPSQRRGYRNNGNIMVELEEEEEAQFRTIDWMGQQVRLSEKAIKLDFIDKARTARLREKVVAAQMGLPQPPYEPYKPWVVGTSPTPRATPIIDPKETALIGRTSSEREAADILLNLSHPASEDVISPNWQDSIVLQAASLVRDAPVDNEENVLLKLQALINGRLAEVQKHSQSPIQADQPPMDEEREIELLTEQAEAEASSGNVGISLRSGRRISEPENGIHEEESEPAVKVDEADDTNQMNEASQLDEPDQVNGENQMKEESEVIEKDHVSPVEAEAEKVEQADDADKVDQPEPAIDEAEQLDPVGKVDKDGDQEMS